MACYVRLMCKEDIPQVLAIDREAFPTQWPPPSFQHELKNRLAHYIVACDDSEKVESAADDPPGDTPVARKGISGLFSRFGRWLSGKNEELPPGGDRVIGFVGFWAMADEAHITSIAVRESLQRQGIGEHLLITSIDMAGDLHSNVVTLEVRASNLGAQVLYAKHGFNKKGIRKGYYTDNREDGIVMTTDYIHSESYQNRMRELKKAHGEKWGINHYPILRH